MSYATGTEGYYKKMLELQEKLRRSEEERLKLEEKFNEMMRISRDVEHERLRVLRHKYHRFLEEDRVRQDRNENILRSLDRIESRAKMFAAKTDRFKALRKQYEVYIRRIYATKKQNPYDHASTHQAAQSHSVQTYSNARKQLFSDIPMTERAEEKIAMLEQYLQDNFNNNPNGRSPKSRESVLNENRLFNRQNDYSPGYSLPEEPSQDVNNLRQNYVQPEIVIDSDSKDSQDYSVENGFPPRRIDKNLRKHESELMAMCPGKDNQQHKQSEKSQLLGNTIEKELDRFREKENVKQIAEQKIESDSTKESPDPYVQSYKDLVSESAKKFGLHNGSLTGSPKRIIGQKMDTQDENKLHLPVKVLDDTKNTDNILPDKIIPHTSPQEEENKMVDINKKKLVEQQENSDSENENPVIKKYKELTKTLKEDDIPNEETSKETLPIEQQILEEVSPGFKDNGEVLPCMEKLEVFEQDDNVDLRSKTPEVSSGRTEPPDDVTLTTMSPIHLPLSEESINRQKRELLVPESKNLPADIIQNDSDSISEQSSISKELEINKNAPPKVSTKEQIQSSSENISAVHEQKLVDNKNYPSEQPLQQLNKDNQNFPQEELPVYQKHSSETEVSQPGYQEVYETEQPVDVNQEYQNPKQVEGSEVYQPQEGYDPQSYPAQEHLEGEIYDAQKYPADQQQYSADQEHYSVDPEQYPTDQGHYPVDQQQYSVDQKHSIDQQQYPADQQQYPVDPQQYAVDQQQYPADQQQYPVDPQQYAVDQQQYLPDQQQYPVDQQEYPAVQQQYPVNHQQYPVDQKFSIDQQQYSTNQEQYPVVPQEYPADHEQYPATPQEYPADQEQYPVNPQEYPVDSQEYPVDPQEYPVDPQEYPVDSQEYPVNPQQYPVDPQQYPVDPQQYPVNQQQYQGEYSPEQYSGDHQQFIEKQPTEYDPTQYPQNQPYPEAEYDPQQYPKGYNQDVYRTEEEYLQGEQNIDMQYQSEVAGQEYKGEYPNQEYQHQEYQQGVTDQGHQLEQTVTPQQSVSEPVKSQEVEQEKSLPIEQNVSESIEKSTKQNVVHPEDKPLVEKKLPNLADMLDTDTESTKQETKVSNESDFDFSNT